MRRVQAEFVERTIIAVLLLVVVGLMIFTSPDTPRDASDARQPGARAADSSPPTTTVAEDDALSRSLVDALPRAVPVDLPGLLPGDAGPAIREPLPRPWMPADSLSVGLPERGQWRGASLLVDLDGDSHLDLVSSVRRYDGATPGEGLFVFRGDGQGGWSPSVDGLRRDMGYGGSDVADVDGDGLLDLAFSGHQVTPHVFLAEGAGGWRPMSTGLVVPGMCADVALGDFDRDGLVDLAALGFQREGGGLHLFVGTGGGAFAPLPSLLPTDVFGAQVRALDLDGDGHPELVASTSLGPRVWRFDGVQPVAMSDGLPTPEIGGSDIGVDAADLDGDGFAELLVTGMIYPGHDPVRLFRWDGAAWQRWGQGLPDDESCFDGRFARLGGGDDLWLVLAGRAGVGLVRMLEPGVFESVGRLEGTEGVFDVAVGDVDHDGRDEVAFVGIGGVRVLRPRLPDALLAAGDRT